MCGMFVFNSENSCCNEQDGWVRFLDGFDGTVKRCDDSNARRKFAFVVTYVVVKKKRVLQKKRKKIPATAANLYYIPSGSSGCGDSHSFCNASSILQTRTDWSRDHVISSSQSDEDWFRFGLQAKSSTTSVWPTNEQIGALCFELFHNSKLFSPRPRCGTITVTKPSANGYLQRKTLCIRVHTTTKREVKFHSAFCTVYLARHTGDDVVIILSARLGLFMSKYFTVPSWLAVVKCVS